MTRLRNGRHFMWAAALLSAFAHGCVRAPAETQTQEPESELQCPEPDRFAVEFTNTRVQQWRDELSGDEGAPPWRKSWTKSVMAQLDRARVAHNEAFAASCLEHLESVETWARHRACFDEARASIRERFETSSRWAAESPERLALAPEWPWRMAQSIRRCTLAPVAAMYTPIDNTVADSLEMQTHALWIRTYALAELGDLDSAARELVDLQHQLADGMQPRLGFEATLLDAWIKLAAGNLPAAEAALGPGRTAADGLGPPAQIDFAFFEGATAAYAGDAPRAAAVFVRARKLAQSLGPPYVGVAAEAAVQATSAWADGESPKAQRELAQAQSGFASLAADAIAPGLRRWVSELALRLAPDEDTRAAHQEAVTREAEALGTDHPSLQAP